MNGVISSVSVYNGGVFRCFRLKDCHTDYYQRVIDFRILLFFRIHYISSCRNLNTVFHGTKATVFSTFGRTSWCS